MSDSNDDHNPMDQTRINLCVEGEPDFDIVKYARMLLNSEQYRQWLEHRISTMSLPERIEIKLMELASTPDKRKRLTQQDPATPVPSDAATDVKPEDVQDMTHEELQDFVGILLKQLGQIKPSGDGVH